MSHFLGYLPDPHKRPTEKQDLDADEVLQLQAPFSFPARHSNRHLIKDVLDQRNIGSCVANAVLQAVRASHVKQGAQSPLLGSRLFTYFCSRLYHNDTRNDFGTYLRTAFASLNKFGFCPEGDWPYEDIKRRFSRIPPTSAFRAAIDQRSPTTYRRIYEEGQDRLDAIKQALFLGYLVAFGTNVSTAFVDGDIGSAPIKPPINQPIAGGHAMCFVGYDEDGFDVVNSWGTGFGENGYCTFSPEYVAWPGVRDLWIVEHAPRYSTTS